MKPEVTVPGLPCSVSILVLIQQPLYTLRKTSLPAPLIVLLASTTTASFTTPAERERERDSEGGLALCICVSCIMGREVSSRQEVYGAVIGS